MKFSRVLNPMFAVAISGLEVACGSSTADPSGDSGAIGGKQPGVGGSTTATQSSGGSTSTTAPKGGSTATTSQGGANSGGTVATGTAGKAAETGGTTAAGGASANGGTPSNGGAPGNGGAVGKGGNTGKGGASNAGGSATTGGTPAAGGASSGGGPATGGSANVGGSGTTRADGPCDIYSAANTPCVAAYSMVRALTKTYTGPLYQVRAGSSAQNTGTGGTLKDIGMLEDGYADAAAQDAFCSGTICTVAKLYDQSGRGNHLPVAKKGLSGGGAYAAMDDFESSATKGPITAGGHKVYSLYMAAREGYRLAAVGAGMPRGTAAQGIYMLADGTHYGTACCWDFGNVTTDPTKYHLMNTLFFGVAYWGRGAGNGPWFMADFEAGVWAGGSKAGDPGWGALDTTSPPNTNNPSMAVPWAFGVLKTTPTNYSLRMANLATATNLTTAFSGALPKAMDNQGGIVLGVGGDNSNNSWGTFFEGAITAGAPSDATDLAVMQNVKAVGYAK